MIAATRTAEALKAYLEPRSLLMLALGFSSGLPFLLTGNTFGYWLRDEGTTLTAIGFLSWVGIVYSLKFLWAPIVDRVRAPLFGRLGHRRGWMALSQVAVGAGLIAMAAVGTHHGLFAAGVLAFVVAFASATQDIAVDALRIESARNDEELGLLSAQFQLGYRVALIAADALILIVAAGFGWPLSYTAFGLLMTAGLIATFLVREPARADAATASRAPLWQARGFYDAVIGPFREFVRAHGPTAIFMLVAISLYRLPDFLMGPMANPFYHDIGLSKEAVGIVRGSFGLIASFAGIAAGGFCVLRLGLLRALIAGGVFQALAIGLYAVLAHEGVPLWLFATVMAGDNFAISFAGVALVAYLSSLTSLGYTATQYAILTSCYAWIGKITKGLSGRIVDGLTVSQGPLGAYAVFFIGAGIVGVPAILMFAWLERRRRQGLPPPPAFG